MLIIKIIIPILILLYCTSDYLPVIGVLSNPDPDNSDNAQKSFIPITYIRWLEASGASVIPIHQWINLDDLETLLGKINGVLWTGEEAEH
jgi:hypothetical protein